MSKDKPKFDREAFKKAIAMIESRGGKDLDNPNSSAAGRYHFLYRYIKDTPLLKGVSKREFINRPELQEKVMDMAIDGKLPGFKGYESYSNKLKAKYNTNLRSDEIAALTHFLGAGGVNKYLKDPSTFQVPGVNSSVYDYVNRFNKAQGTVPSYETDMKKTMVNAPSIPSFSSDLEGFSPSVPIMREESTPEIYSTLNVDFDEKAYSSQLDNQAAQEMPAVVEQEFNITGENQGADYVNYLVNQHAMGGSLNGGCGGPGQPPCEDKDRTYNQKIPEENKGSGIGNTITPLARKLGLSSDENLTDENISLDIPKGQLKFFQTGQYPLNSKYILGGEYIEEEPTAFKAKEYPKQRYTKQGQKEDIDFNNQKFYGIVDGNLKFGNIKDFKDDDTVVALRKNFGGEYSAFDNPVDLKENERIKSILLGESFSKDHDYFKLKNNVYNSFLEDSSINDIEEIRKNLKKTTKYKGKELRNEDIIKASENKEKFSKLYQDAKELYGIDIEKDGIGKLSSIVESDNPYKKTVLDSDGNQLSSYGNKILIFSPETNEHKFISQDNKTDLYNELIKFKKKYPDANYLNMDNGRFERYMSSPNGITPENAFKYSQSDFQRKDNLGYNFAFAEGGQMNSNSPGNELIQFNEGGTHEQNPLGGIPQGMGANGKMNTVEEGETKYAFDDGDYVFSNRIML